MTDQADAQEAFKSWKQAERAYRKATREFFSVVEGREPAHSLSDSSDTMTKLTNLREDADAARTDYEDALD